MLVALCEDEKHFLNFLKNFVGDILFSLEEESKIDTFENGQELLNCEKFYDVYILDIRMPGINGLEAAKKIRESYEDAIIIFLTGFAEYVWDCFRSQPFDYILKTKVREKLPDVIMDAYTKLHNGKRDVFSCSSNGSMYSIPYTDIIYFEYLDRMIYLHMKNGKSITFNGKMKELEERLKRHAFLRIHSALLINMRFITEISRFNALLMNCQVDLPVSKRRYRKCKEAFARFLKEEF